MTPATAERKLKPVDPLEGDVGAQSTGQDFALVGSASDLTLFAADKMTVKKSETKLPAITVPTSGQFQLGDTFELIVPARVVRVIFTAEGDRLHVLEADTFSRFNGVSHDEKGEEPGEEEQK